MDKQQIIARLKETIGHIDTIKEDEFDYSEWVSKSERRCGTVCCIAGWYPKFFPAHFAWKEYENYLYPFGRSGHIGEIHGALIEFHGFRYRAINCLFIGSELVSGDVRIFNQIASDSKIEIVKQRFIRFLELLETGTELDEFLIIE